MTDEPTPVEGEESTTVRPLRVFLVDDHAMFRAGVRAELGVHVDVVGEASSVAEAVSKIAGTLPDVVLLDVHMPDGGGRAVLEAMRRTHPQVRFLALSVSDAAEDVIGLIRAGARGYVTKTISPEELAAAIRRVADGDAVFSPRLAGFVPDRRHGGRPGARPAHQPRARGVAAAGARLRLQGDREGAVHLDQDGRDARVKRFTEAPDVQQIRIVPLGGGPSAGLTRDPHGVRERRTSLNRRWIVAKVLLSPQDGECLGEATVR
jgi:DNA-binding NarL/FixJ family response regulator